MAANCQMCWNEWQSLQRTPIRQLPDSVQVCRNCGRSMGQMKAFLAFHGVDIDKLEQMPLETEADSDSSQSTPLTPRSRPAKK